MAKSDKVELIAGHKCAGDYVLRDNHSYTIKYLEDGIFMYSEFDNVIDAKTLIAANRRLGWDIVSSNDFVGDLGNNYQYILQYTRKKDQ